MDRIQFTQANVEALTLRPDRYEVGDLKVPSLVLRVGAKSKTWTMAIKRHGRRVRTTLGTFPDLGVAEARRLAVGAAADVFADRDIRGATKRKAAITFLAAFESFLADRIDNAGTRRSYSSVVNCHLAPIHHHLLGNITPEAVAALHKKISQSSPSKANLAARVIRAVFNHHIRRGATTLVQPVSILSQEGRWNRVRRKTTAIPARDVPEFIARVMAFDICGSSAADAALFTLFTGCRASEVCGLRWADIDMAVGTFRILENKANRPVTMPLNRQTREVLQRRQDHPDTGKSEWVFPSPAKAGAHIADMRSVFERLADEGFGKFCAQDLRRGFAASLDAIGAGSYAVKSLLNHARNSDADVTAGYINSEIGTLLRFSQAAADFLSAGGFAQE